MKNLLITGAAGFVSGHFLEYLKENNLEYNILATDILEDFKADYKNFKYKKINLREREQLKEILADFKPDYILHLASISSVSQSWKQPVESFVNNTNIFLNIIESIRELELPTRILSIGSSEEYGNYPAEKMPLHEDYKLLPCNPYAVARVSQEMLSKLYADCYNVNIIMTRSFNHIGPKQREAFVVPSFVKQLIEIKNSGNTKPLVVGNIEIVRDFLDVRDVVDAYYKLLTQGKIGEVYNVCSGKGVKLKEIIEIVSDKLEICPKIEIDSSRVRPTDNMIIVGDNSKLKSEFNWNPIFTLESSLNDIIDYLSQDRRNQNECKNKGTV